MRLFTDIINCFLFTKNSCTDLPWTFFQLGCIHFPLLPGWACMCLWWGGMRRCHLCL